FSPTGLPTPVAAFADGGSHAFDHDRFDLPRSTAPEGGGFVVFRRCETCHALLQGREFDHDEAMEFIRSFHDLKTSAPGENLSAKLGNDGVHQVGIFFIFDRVVDLGTRNPVSRHISLPLSSWPGLSRPSTS